MSLKSGDTKGFSFSFTQKANISSEQEGGIKCTIFSLSYTGRPALPRSSLILVSWYLGIYKHRDLCMVTPSGRPNSAHCQNDMHAIVFVHFCKGGFFPQYMHKL